VRRHRRALHLAERAAFGDRLGSRDPAERILAGLSSDEAGALARSVRAVPSSRHMLILQQQRSALGGGRTYLAFARRRWQAFVEDKPLRLRRADRSTACLLRTGPFCWERKPGPGAARVRYVLIGAVVAVGIALLVVVAAVASRLRTRRRARQERLFILRTLAHELRTPATGLNLSVEPLRDEFDRLSPAGQRAFLRVCDDIQRLNRVVRSSERYLQSSGNSGRMNLSIAQLDSVNDFLDAVLEGIDGPVTLTRLEVDQSARADPFWLSVCVRNLIDNALEHGRPPVCVRAAVSDSALTIVVSDGGSLPRGVSSDAFARGADSHGLGLGLNIVAHLMEKMRGKLTWQRDPTAFALQLPRGER
jgi:signal transduction histidine kinase